MLSRQVVECERKISEYKLQVAEYERKVAELLCREAPRITGQQIMSEVAKAYGVTLNDLRSAGRTKEMVKPRHEAMYRIATETELTFPQIGRMFGKRDHTTVLHAVRMHYERADLAAQGVPAPRGMRRES